jgi:hypothetical protein
VTPASGGGPVVEDDVPGAHPENKMITPVTRKPNVGCKGHIKRVDRLPRMKSFSGILTRDRVESRPRFLASCAFGTNPAYPKIRVTHRLTGDKAFQSGKLDIFCNHPLDGWDWRLVD